MKMLKKIAITTLCCLLLPVKSSPNLPVIDLSAIAATIAGFVNSVEETTKSSVTLLNQLDAMEKTYEQMKDLKDVYTKIDAYMYNMQELADIIETSSAITKSTSDIYKSAVTSRVYYPNELKFLLDQLTVYVKDVATLTQRVSAILDPKLFKWSSAERVKGVDES
ncbi:MAG: hypothetical protein LBJ57_03070, partial [Prevotellaceae bacterium]|nr:hypothetical protein [Prevotellaceae bacterium]